MADKKNGGSKPGSINSIPNSDALWFDVTASLGLPRITGIQRVLRSVIAGGGGTELIFFDPRIGGYRRLARLPTLTPRVKRTEREAVKPLLNTIGLRLAGKLSETKWLSERIRRGLHRIGLWMYVSLLSPEKYKTDDNLEGIPIGVAELPTIWLLEIPRSANHLQFLKDNVSTGSMRLGLYLYDIIPTKDIGLGGAPDNGYREHYQRYLSLCKHAQVVVHLSRTSQDEFIEYRISQGLTVPGAEHHLYPPLREELELTASAATAASADRPTGNSERLKLLCVGALTTRKNLGLVFDCVMLPSFTVVDWELTVLSPQVAHSDRLVSEKLALVRRSFPSRLKVVNSLSGGEVRKLYRDADALIYPSLSEGLGLPILEAYASGLEVFCSDLPVFRELGEFVPMHFVDSNNPEDLAAKLIRFEKSAEDPQPKFSFLPNREEFLDRLKQWQTE